MKIQDLQQPYRALAEMRREQQINSEWVKQYEKEFKEINDLNFAFYWENTPEGNDWWNYLNEGSTPEIPAESLSELKEWQNKKQCFDCKGDIDKEGQCFCNKDYEPVLIAEQPNDKLFQSAVAAMQGMVANSRIALTDTLLVKYSWDLAEALINEGKKRGHL